MRVVRVQGEGLPVLRRGGGGGQEASSAGPSNTTDTAGAARPTQGNIAQSQDAAGGTSGSPKTGTRENIRRQVTGDAGSAGTGTGATAGGTGGGAGASASAAANANANAAGGGAAVASSVTATIPAGQTLPAVVVSLVRDGGEWRMNVPDTLTAGRLEANLARHLSAAARQAEQWPNDANQAQQVIAHHLVMALMDRDANEAAR